MDEQLNEYYEWSILSQSTIQSKRLPLSDIVIHNYQGMTNPEQISDNKYKVRISTKSYWKYSNDWIMLESIVNAMLNTNVKTQLFVSGADEKSVVALTFLMNIIEHELHKYAFRTPDIANRYVKPSIDETKQIVRQLLLSKNKLEN